jgi:hypothetical protein
MNAVFCLLGTLGVVISAVVSFPILWDHNPIASISTLAFHVSAALVIWDF